MKKLLVFVIASAACTVVNAQIDTTRKPQDTIPKSSDSLMHTHDTVVNVSLADTVQLHARDTNESAPMSDKPMRVYKIKPAIDLPIIAAGTAFSLHGFSVIYNKPSTPEEHILSLRKSDINGFDRRAANNYDENADKVSDYLFYGAIPAPLLYMIADGKVRKQFGSVFLVWWETMAVTGVYYTGAAYVVDRYRPLAYNPNAPMHERTSGNAKNSFIGGHPAQVGSSLFFVAKVYSDFHPESNAKWVFYSVAGAATAATAYLRFKAGKHFPSDLIAGSIMGPLTGILIPHFHKNKLFKKHPNLSIRPFTGSSHGLLAVYKF